ncbi:MAG: hypothetical protein P0Y59_05580 [Candidatus Sphingomonas phytovorans]|nr:hypothetical protein [Sphingomonas sp.]WEK01160.1 MAG: hypothetical protein P0Y59_05580 [Sphingomonas sp.]
MYRNKILLSRVAVLAFLLSGCSGNEDSGQTKANAAVAISATPFNTSLPTKEFMLHVMQYAGDGVWKRQGWVSDKSGERSLFPRNEAEWEEAESASLTLAEITNVLLIPGRRVEEPAWDDAVKRVRNVALVAAAAAEKHDQAAFLKAGGDLDVACDSCHEHYDPTFVKPAE